MYCILTHLVVYIFAVSFFTTRFSRYVHCEAPLADLYCNQRHISYIIVLYCIVFHVSLISQRPLTMLTTGYCFVNCLTMSRQWLADYLLDC